MIHYIEVSSTGEITNAGSSGGFASEEHFLSLLPGRIVLPAPLQRIGLYYWDGTKVVEKGIKPSVYHYFDYTNKLWIGNTDEAWFAVKSQRSELLSKTDWAITKANELGTEVPTQLKGYRQALRDITLQKDPWNIIWPELP